MRVYNVCELDTDTGYIMKIDSYITLETAINRAIVIIKENVKFEDYISSFVVEATSYLKQGLNYEDECGVVRIIVKDAI